jgi:hypothetical protein
LVDFTIWVADNELGNTGRDSKVYQLDFRWFFAGKVYLLTSSEPGNIWKKIK